MRIHIISVLFIVVVHNRNEAIYPHRACLAVCVYIAGLVSVSIIRGSGTSNAHSHTIYKHISQEFSFVSFLQLWLFVTVLLTSREQR